MGEDWWSTSHPLAEENEKEVRGLKCFYDARSAYPWNVMWQISADDGSCIMVTV